ncbi:MAG: hypothetical protein IT385_15455 [Deltaproteobacteria bacterium]|nr:hypothetical protein [Deltaproteobacteria bacterium]
MRRTPLVALTLAAGCLEPLVDDAIVRDDLLLAAGSLVPELASDAASTAALEAHIPVETRGLVRARRAFHDGAPIVWWDLGPASATPVPAYVLVADRDNGELLADGRRLAPLDHPVVVTAVPGDLAYGPLVRLVLVPVTASYTGELLTSRAAIEHAAERGLVEPPLEIPLVATLPIVLASARLEPAPGQAPVAPARVFYEGRAAYAFELGRHFAPGAHVAIGIAYTLRREGGERISEVLRGVDLTGDGDADDSNDLFARGPGDIGYAPLVQVTEVVVAREVGAIDTYGDDRRSDLMSAARLFEPDGVTLDGALVRGVAMDDRVVARPFVFADDVEASP